MNRGAWVGLLAALSLSGCGVVYDDDDSAASGAPPRVEFSSPGVGVLVLARQGSIGFLAEGVDDDSLALRWSYSVDDVVAEEGAVDDGQFSAEWTLLWSDEIAGAELEVAFVVDDGALESRISWPVDVNP